MDTPQEKLKAIPADALKGTPLEMIQSALLQHFEDDATNFNSMHDLLKSIDAKLTPIAETYATVGTMGKWSMAGLVSISMVVGILFSIWQFVSAFKK